MECKDHVDRKDPKRLISFLTFENQKKKKRKIEVANCSIRNQKKKTRSKTITGTRSGVKLDS